MTVKFADSYTGSNGSAPNSTTHVTSTTGTGSVVDVQSNALRLLAGSSGSGASTGRSILRDAAGANLNIADGEVFCTWSYQNPKVEQYPCILFRTSNDWWATGPADSITGYTFFAATNGNTCSFQKFNTGETLLGSPQAVTFTAGTNFYMRVKFVGSSLQGKIWDVGTAEPSAWTLTVTDATFSTGGIQICNENGAPAASRTSTIDELTVTDLTWTERLGRRR